MSLAWADERYVRLYTRDTVDWVAWGWEAQALFTLVLRKVDRAGTLALGKHGARGLAGLVAMPLEVVERALRVLLEDGALELHGTVLVARNFIEAQEARASDRQRQQECRARKRDLARAAEMGTLVPKEAVAAPPVTFRDEVSQPVTSSHSVPSRTVPYLTEVGVQAEAAAPAAPPPPGETSVRAAPEAPVTESLPPQRLIPLLARVLPPREATPAPEKSVRPPGESAELERPQELPRSSSATPPDRFASGDAFFAAAQAERLEAGLTTEKRPRGLNPWFAGMLKEVPPEGIQHAFSMWQADSYWRRRGYPFQAFMSQWRQYVDMLETPRRMVGL
jgi:hypothetical protein